MKLVTLDYETEAIIHAPALHPPKPVGLGIAIDDNDPDYLDLTDPEQLEAAKGILKQLARDDKVFFLGHNIHSFDNNVTRDFLDDALKGIHPKRIIDTLVLAAIYSPLSPSLSLKPLASELLGIPPEERDAVRAWLIENKVVTKTQKDWGAFNARAPIEIVGPYCKADVTMTRKLFRYFGVKATEGGNIAEQREQLLAPILNNMTRRGVRVDVQLLQGWQHNYSIEQQRADAHIRSILGTQELNIDSNSDLADAIERAGLTSGWPSTPTGKRRVDKESLETCVTHAELKELLRYRGVLATYLGTFIRPWLAMAEMYGGRIHPQWDAVRGERGGTRTGRIASHDPNLMNVPKKYEVPPPLGFLPPPNLRRALLPEPDHVWVSADFDGQELRGLAHFVGGLLEQAYIDNPKLDIHSYVVDTILKTTGKTITRKAAKTVAFLILYGGGNNKLAAGLGCSYEEAVEIRRLYYAALPGIEEFIEDVQLRGKMNKAVRTWGGRDLFAPLDKDGRPRHYALVNYLIQGSCADLTKAAVCMFNAKCPDIPILATVHDEINISVPKNNVKSVRASLEEAMCYPRLSVPMTVTVTQGPNWADQK